MASGPTPPVELPVDLSGPVAVLFVCLGNICRSPTAEGVFRHRVARDGLADRIATDSAGTGEWHIGKPPHRDTMAAAKRRGYDLSALRARLVTPADFQRFPVILAMDRSNLGNLRRLQPAGFAGHLGLFLDFAPDQPIREMPDPYGGEPEDFDQVLDLVEEGVEGLLKSLRGAGGSGAPSVS